MTQTLKGQTVITLISALPVSILFISQPSGFMFSVIDLLMLIIPLAVFCVLFGRMKTGRGVEFKFIRILVASVLWLLVRYSQVVLYHELKPFFGLPYSWKGTLLFCFDIISLPLVVVISYYLGKFIHNIIYRIGNGEKNV